MNYTSNNNNCNIETRFLELLRRSTIRSTDGRFIEDLYNAYLSRQTCAFPIESFARDIGLEINITPLQIKESGKLEGNVITVNSKKVLYRRNFIIAHKVAHYVLEHGNKTDYKADIVYTAEQRLQEDEANYFATSILLPTNIIHQEVRGFKVEKNISLLKDDHARELIQKLSHKFKVSTSLVIIKLKDLDYISGWIWI